MDSKSTNALWIKSNMTSAPAFNALMYDMKIHRKKESSSSINHSINIARALGLTREDRFFVREVAWKVCKHSLELTKYLLSRSWGSDNTTCKKDLENINNEYIKSLRKL